MSLVLSTLDPCPAGPPGVQLVGRGAHFRVYAEAAERVELCVFSADGSEELARHTLPDCTDGVWHGCLPGAGEGLVYGYRVHGPYEPWRGQRFNRHKLLLDPYARATVGELVWDDALFGYPYEPPGVTGGIDWRLDARDSAPFMPKAVLVSEEFDWQGDTPPRTPWRDTVIYELHVKGFSRQRKDLPEELRGSYRALGSPGTIAHLRALGVTAIELLPIHSFVRDRRLVDVGLTNYWGYNTLAFFAPEAAYGTREDLKRAIRDLHKAGIEVILDVVYNHSAEGDERGPTLSLRGFGNAEYYRLQAGDPTFFVNDTGCGNTLNFQNPRVIQLVMDSLRHWVSAYHIDGFRFDLGVTLGREAQGFDPGAGFFDALRQDPWLSRVELISEPWDVGPDGYQIGRHLAGLAEWNGLARDDYRRYWRGNPGTRGALATRLQGSADRFDHRRRRPWASINFITAHDGFTLQDLVSYATKHNEANREDNRDGCNDNDSSNWGVEGATFDTGIVAQRARIQRALIATLAFSHGTPMLLAGDEFGQTQWGNNNAYCQDSPLTWLDWSRLTTPEGRALRDFVARAMALRREYPALRAEAFQHGRSEPLPGWVDTFWFDERGVALTPEDWSRPQARLLGLRRVAPSRDGREHDALLLLFNADSIGHIFSLPTPRLPLRVLLDSGSEPSAALAVVPGHCMVGPGSVVLLGAKLDAQGRPR